MLARLAAVAAMAALMGCAGLEPAGRNASRAPEAAPAPTYSAPPPAPAPAAAPPVASAPPVAAPVAAPPPTPTPTPAPTTAAADPPEAVVTTSRPRGGDIVVPAERERQVEAPDGDPRSDAERMQDINAWDRCVTHVQAAYERDPMRPQLTSPEEYCSQSLGMSNRSAIPISRQERRR